MSGRRARAYAALAVMVTIWSYNWIVVRIATQDATPFALTALRTIVATCVLFAILIASRRSLRPPPLGPTVLMGVVNTAAFLLFQTLSVASGGAGKAAVLYYTWPFMVALLAAWLLKERLQARTVAGLGIAAVGLAFVVLPLDVTRLAVVFYGLLTALSWSGGAVIAKRLRASGEVDLLALTAWQALFGPVPLVIAALLVPGQHVAFTPAFVASVLYLGAFGTGVAMILWLFALQRLTAAAAALPTLVVPVASVALAAWQLHERLTPSELTGIGLIVGALALDTIRLPSARAEPR
ncbi:MAG: DMT family transporter [Candidatus Eremiobacteraeota bacterium]|nr:DMT family transporter [Candidatus Eremiobacteraeota bacterium]